MPEPRWSAAVALMASMLLAAPAVAIVGDRDEAFGIDGSLRTITGASYNYEHSLFEERSDGFSQTILRLEIGGEPTDWFKYEIHGVQDLNLSTTGGAFGSELLGTGTNGMYRFTDVSWDWGETAQVQARLWLDRFALKFSLPWFDLTLGRQAVTFGKAYFWNPLDVFQAFDPRSFDRDYKPGVDALRIDVSLGDFSGLTLVGALGRTLEFSKLDEPTDDVGVSWLGSSILLRAYTMLWDWDFAIQGGKVYGGYQVGAATSGELGPLEVRAEGAYFISMDADLLFEPRFSSFIEPRYDAMPDHFTGVLGIGHRFEFNLQIEAEYMYNGAGDPDRWYWALLRMGAGRSYHMGEHLLGVMANYKILPILQGSIAWIFSFSDYSSLIQPGFVLSVSDEADFIMGAMIALGARPVDQAVDFGDNPIGMKSEFGTYPNFYYMEFKFYF
jgi:hypothetical protein